MSSVVWVIGVVLATGITAFVLGGVSGWALGQYSALQEAQNQ